MKKIITGLIFVVFLFLMASQKSEVFAFSVKTGDYINIPKSEVVEGNLFTAGKKIVLEGNIKGDIVCAGQDVEINSQVDGDVICAAQNIIINGLVSGSVRAAAQMININGQVNRNVSIVGQNITNNAIVSGEFLFAGQTLKANGLIGGDLWGASETVDLNGKIGKNVNLIANNIIAEKNAWINGNFTYESEKPLNLQSGSIIAGETKHNLPKKETANYQKNMFFNNFTKVSDRGFQIINLFVQFLFSLFLLFVFRKQFEAASLSVMTAKGKSFLFGLLILIVTPALGILFFLTIIGIPVTILLVIGYLLALFVGRVIIVYIVGRKLIEVYWPAKTNSIVIITIIGTAITWLFFSLPVVGGFLSCIAVILGLGGVYFLFRPNAIPLAGKQNKKLKKSK